MSRAVLALSASPENLVFGDVSDTFCPLFNLSDNGNLEHPDTKPIFAGDSWGFLRITVASWSISTMVFGNRPAKVEE